MSDARSYSLFLGRVPFEYPDATKPQNMNRLTVTLRITDQPDGKTRVSLSGDVHSHRRRDYVAAGQIQDLIRKYIGQDRYQVTDATVQRLCDLWDRWHLNDMRAGSPRQELWLRCHPDTPQDYGARCDALAAAGLNPDQLHGDGYKYGHAWLYEEVPADVLTELVALFTATPGSR